MKKKSIISSKNLKGFREADQIISFLEDPTGPSALPVKTKANYERYVIIHSMLMRYQTHSAVIGFLKDKYDRSERMARYDIAETEYIFGKLIKVNRAYEIAYLLEISRKNIEIAMNTKNTKMISMAIKEHLNILGPELDESLLPDFSDFEPHKYSIVLPTNLQSQLITLINSGAVNLSESVPSRMINFDAEDAEEVA